jgi:glycosyltransferase involved in cell wall biosynthesis
MDDTNRWIFIAWAPRGRRSESLARDLGAQLYFIHYLRFQKPLYAPAKYILQTIRTLQVLFLERPEIIFAQNPPFVCGLMVYLYCRISRACFVLDHHSAAFSHVWDWALPIQKFLARHAITNLVTNQHWADMVHSWSAEVSILIDPLPTLPEGQDFVVGPGFNVVFINTFADDEPIEAVLGAAAQLPDVCFYITGDTERKPASFFVDVPSNVTFTGFLPEAQYSGLLRAGQAVMALTTRDHTLQGGGFEAVSLGKPLITSDWPYLQELFPKGTVYVANSADGIRDGIWVMRRRHKDLEREMITFRQESRREWDARFAQLKKLIASHMSTPARKS